jgi:hypothetical protein
MRTEFSRRWLFAALGGGVVGAASASIAWRATGDRPRTSPAAKTPGAVGYVDHDGWMLTPADKEKVSRRQ